MGSMRFLWSPDTNKFNLNVVRITQRFRTIGWSSRKDTDSNLPRLVSSEGPMNIPCLPWREAVSWIRNLHRLTDFILLGEGYVS